MALYVSMLLISLTSFLFCNGMAVCAWKDKAPGLLVGFCVLCSLIINVPWIIHWSVKILGEMQ